MNVLLTKQVVIDPGTIEELYDVLKLDWVQRWKGITVEIPFKTFMEHLLTYMNLYRGDNDAMFIADVFCKKMDLPPITYDAFIAFNNICKELQRFSELVNPHLDGMRLLSQNKNVLIIEIQAHETISDTANSRPSY